MYVHILTCYYFVSAGPTGRPERPNACALTLSLECDGEEKREGVEEEGLCRGGGRMRGMRTLDIGSWEHVRFSALIFALIFSSVLFFNFSSFFSFLSSSPSVDRERTSSESL